MNPRSWESDYGFSDAGYLAVLKRPDEVNQHRRQLVLRCSHLTLSGHSYRAQIGTIAISLVPTTAPMANSAAAENNWSNKGERLDRTE